jgi:hypothetical protein
MSGQPAAGGSPLGKVIADENEMVLLEEVPAVTDRVPLVPVLENVAVRIDGFSGRSPAS